LLLLLAATIVLAGAATWLALRPPPTAPTTPDVDPATLVVDMPPEVYRMAAESKFEPRGPVRVGAPDNTLLRLQCDALRMERTTKAGSATFDDIPNAGCVLSMPEQEELAPFEPVYPGDNLQCGAAEGRIRCTGSLAEKHAAKVIAWSWGEGALWVDGVEVGPVPVESLRIPVGKHDIKFQGPRARSEWRLTVQPDERIELFFHAPARDGQSGLTSRPREAIMTPPTP
jgi:hypothetical protein